MNNEIITVGILIIHTLDHSESATPLLAQCALKCYSLWSIQPNLPMRRKKVNCQILPGTYFLLGEQSHTLDKICLLSKETPNFESKVFQRCAGRPRKSQGGRIALGHPSRYSSRPTLRVTLIFSQGHVSANMRGLATNQGAHASNNSINFLTVDPACVQGMGSFKDYCTLPSVLDRGQYH